MGRGSSKKRDIKKDGLTPAQTKRREKKKANRATKLEKKGVSKPATPEATATEPAN